MAGMPMGGITMASTPPLVSLILVPIFLLIIVGYLIRFARGGRSVFSKEFPHLCCALLMLPMLMIVLIQNSFIVAALFATIVLTLFFVFRALLRSFDDARSAGALWDLSHVGMFAGMAVLYFTFGHTLINSAVAGIVWALCVAFYFCLTSLYFYRLVRALPLERRLSEAAHVVLALSMFAMFAWPGIFM